jgi:hypothetical protein
MRNGGLCTGYELRINGKMARHVKLQLKLELELTQPQMAQKPMLRGEVGALGRSFKSPWSISIYITNLEKPLIYMHIALLLPVLSFANVRASRTRS